MKKLLVCLGMVLTPLYNYGVTTNVVVKLEHQQQEKMKLLFGLLDSTASLENFASTVCTDLSCSKQKKSGFDCVVEKFEKVPSKNVLRQRAQDGYMMVVFLQKKSNHQLEWRIYDASQAQMYCGKRMKIDPTDEAMSAHMVADSIWELLTGQPGIFSSRIAYCCEKNEGSHKGSDIFVQTPYADKSVRVVKGGKLLAPRWNKNSQNPLILFSEVTPSNIRLLSSTLNGRKKIVSNFDGMTMLPSFSSNGQSVVYCATHQGTSQIYKCSIDEKTKKQVNQRITHNSGNNTSPNLRDNGDVIFCSDFETKTPQIYYWNAQEDKLERKTKSGYCSSPNFSEKTKKIGFHKLVGSTMQIFTYDIVTDEEKQITFTPGNKDECSFSPCGNYVAYSVEKGKSSRIAVYNMITNEETFITDEHRRCSYPSWSSKN